MNIGIIGIGFVGNAIMKSFIKHYINVICYDKYKQIGSLNECLITDIIFLCLPTLYNDMEKSYDKKEIEELLLYLFDNKYEGIIIIKSTIEPGTCKKYTLKYNNLKIIHNPEFLSAKTADYDFHNQKHIIIGNTNNISKEDNLKIVNLYKKYYPEAIISSVTSCESESIKIFCNSFYAIKIQFFNELYDLCNKTNCNYNIVKECMLMNGWINKMHTDVPGHDGNISYGGACFPKDTNALLQFMIKKNSMCEILKACIREHDNIRNN